MLNVENVLNFTVLEFYLPDDCFAVYKTCNGSTDDFEADVCAFHAADHKELFILKWFKLYSYVLSESKKCDKI